tara:strand:+ start:312 stop:533 length:222 start_codon:yes stop_codon:yes gene_type:complete
MGILNTENGSTEVESRGHQQNNVSDEYSQKYNYATEDREKLEKKKKRKEKGATQTQIITFRRKRCWWVKKGGD